MPQNKLSARAHARTSAAALEGNLRALSRRAGVPLLLPVKAGAYGHGLDVVARIAAGHPDVWGLAVATPQEAGTLAGLNPGKPVVLLTPPRPAEVPVLADLGVRLPVASLEEAENLPPHARAHLKVDTGMNRLGARPEDAVRIGLRLAERGVLEGAYTHFATADEPDLAFAWEQFRRFQQVLAQLPPLLAHASNGGGILSLGALPGMGLARPGLASYGFAPAHLKDVLPLTPIMTLEAEITHLHMARAGETVSYGGLWQATRDTLLATVSLGYADGYPRNATGQAQVIVAGERRPVVGRICMDQCMVDVTGLAVAVGESVRFWGPDSITVGDVAGWGGTNEYEVLTGLGTRVERLGAE
ncbi:alanine racemase [Deinococcus humi]|uniref:Alanine racemase n=1 Tax=Deinococcus humi TaxID=662880 RepID=A0A7W8JXQ8_9DEIO|nr:alanine racemase [Deinococcus humi]MBB5365167.1 alanine racemase [Deinococcus humi]GGO37735.1 alanine racemase [Deinococcus humi]